MKVIFLDIDGVLQAYGSKNRFGIDRESLREELSKKIGIDYSKYNEYDVAACALDWNEEAVNRIKTIINKTGAKIVVSSDWRSEEKPHKVKDFLSIWGMGEYWYADTEIYNSELMKNTDEYVKQNNPTNEYVNMRSIEILDFVFKHKEITNYVAIDDMNLSIGLGEHFVQTDNLINEEQMEKCIEILNN